MRLNGEQVFLFHCVLIQNDFQNKLRIQAYATLKEMLKSRNPQTSIICFNLQRHTSTYVTKTTNKTKEAMGGK